MRERIGASAGRGIGKEAEMGNGEGTGPDALNTSKVADCAGAGIDKKREEEKKEEVEVDDDDGVVVVVVEEEEEEEEGGEEVKEVEEE